MLLDLIAQNAPAIGVFTLDTGRLPEETQVLIDPCARSLRHPHRCVLSGCGAHRGLRAHARRVNAFYDSVELRQGCCAIRKSEPLRRALAGKRAWITGLRRSQSVTRSDLAYEEFDAAHGMPKFNPLADWSEDDVWSYLRARSVPWNALHDRGYRSIGCAPCTRAVEPGEDVRAGRWWWKTPSTRSAGCTGVRSP